MNNAVSLSPRASASSKISILLVEDDQIVQRTHHTMLTSLGCTIDVADNGYGALALYQKRNYSAILLDCGLPDITGIQVAKLIRFIEKNTRRCYTPIVMISAYSNNQIAKECQKVGINEFAAKPMNPQKLAILLQKYTGQQTLFAMALG